MVTRITCAGFDIIFIVQLDQIIVLCIEFLLHFDDIYLFPEVPCDLPPNTKASFLLLPFYLLTCSILRRDVRSHSLVCRGSKTGRAETATAGAASERVDLRGDLAARG